MKKIILGSAVALLLSTAAFAQVPVTDRANTAANEKIKALTSAGRVTVCRYDFGLALKRSPSRMAGTRFVLSSTKR